MTQKLVLIDYGSGNLRSAAKAFEKAAIDRGVDLDIIVSDNIDIIAKADRLVLPGVGAFGDCAKNIRKHDGLWDVIDEAVQKRAIPFFGVCVGMQLMANRGLEHGEHQGFGWINADVLALEAPELKIPHMGWNTLRHQDTHQGTTLGTHPVLEGIADGSDVYFVHSYHMVASAGANIPVISSVNYGHPVTALVGQDNYIGTQFHPEKSQLVGLQLIGNFLEWRP